MNTPDLRQQHKAFAAWYIKHGAAETAEDLTWLAWKAAVLAEREKSEAMRADAERYLHLRRFTQAGRGLLGRQQFVFPYVSPAGLDLFRGSVAQHLDAAIDAEIDDAAIRAEPKEQQP